MGSDDIDWDVIWDKIDPVLIMADTLRLFGQGTKVAVMAADAGTLAGDDIIAVGASGHGADTALVIKPAHQNNFKTLNLWTMIFIAGVTPKIKILDQNPRRCPVCGLNQAYYKRMDHYLSLFFIPILRVKKGEPFIVCERCEQTLHKFGLDFTRQQPEGAGTCRYCGKEVGSDFKFCPHCGRRL